eukprot:PITA_10643
MPAATSTPVFPISEQYDAFDFDPQMHYSQVLVEAGNHGRSETLKGPSCINGSKPIVGAGDISSSKVAEVQKSVGNLKRKRWWKDALFFWKNLSSCRKQEKDQYEVQAIPRRLRFKSLSGPIYMNDVYIDPPHRSNGTHLGPLSGILSPGEGKLGEVPYVALKRPNHTGVSRCRAPLYLVT